MSKRSKRHFVHLYQTYIVMKTFLGISDSAIAICQYLDLRLKVAKNRAPPKMSKYIPIFSNGFASFTRWSLNLRKLVHHLTEPSDFLTSTVGAAQGEYGGRITPASSCSAKCSSKPCGLGSTLSLTSSAKSGLISCKILAKCHISSLCLAKAHTSACAPSGQNYPMLFKKIHIFI